MKDGKTTFWKDLVSEWLLEQCSSAWTLPDTFVSKKENFTVLQTRRRQRTKCFQGGKKGKHFIGEVGCKLSLDKRAGVLQSEMIKTCLKTMQNKNLLFLTAVKI